jgi:hypothetical protein
MYRLVQGPGELPRRRQHVDKCGPRFRIAHARLAARGLRTTVDTIVTMATQEDARGDAQRHLDDSTVETTEEGTSSGPPPSDPRSPVMPTTKAALKKYEFVPRGDLSGYHIPRKPSHAATSDVGESYTSFGFDANSERPISPKAPSAPTAGPSVPKKQMDLPLPRWHPSHRNYPMPGPTPRYQGY